MHKLTPNKEIKAWRGRSLVDLLVNLLLGDEKRHFYPANAFEYPADSHENFRLDQYANNTTQ